LQNLQAPIPATLSQRPDPLARMALTDPTIAIVKATAPILQEHGVAIATRLYERLFAHPEIEALFDPAALSSGEQARRLAGAILAFARNVDRLEALGPAVERMAQRHVRAGVAREHYPVVAHALLGAIQDVLGAAATPAVLDAWGEAYGFLSGVLQSRERELRASLQTA
jgi:hemoglobin-like flavoprotein